MSNVPKKNNPRNNNKKNHASGTRGVRSVRLSSHTDTYKSVNSTDTKNHKQTFSSDNLKKLGEKGEEERVKHQNEPVKDDPSTIIPNPEGVDSTDYNETGKLKTSGTLFFRLEFPSEVEKRTTDNSPLSIIIKVIDEFLSAIFEHYDYYEKSHKWLIGSHRVPPGPAMEASTSSLSPPSTSSSSSLKSEDDKGKYLKGKSSKPAFHGSIILQYDQREPYKGCYLLQLVSSNRDHSNNSDDDDSFLEYKMQLHDFFQKLMKKFVDLDGPKVIAFDTGWNKRSRAETTDKFDSNHQVIVNTLSSKQQKQNHSSLTSIPPLAYAAAQGDLEKCTNLLAEMKPDHFNCRIQKDNALIFACRSGHVSIVSMLLTRGADVLTKYKPYDATGIHYALKYGYPRIIELLLREPDPIRKDVVNSTDYRGRNSLHFAVANEKIGLEIIQSLVNAGANVDCLDHNKCTPLHIAVANKREEIVNYLMNEKGADVSLKNSDGLTPFTMAKQEGFGIIRKLFRDVDTADDVDEESHEIDDRSKEEQLKDIPNELKPLDCFDNVLINVLHLTATGKLCERNEFEKSTYVAEVANQLICERCDILRKIQQQQEKGLLSKMFLEYVKRFSKHHNARNIEGDEVEGMEQMTIQPQSHLPEANPFMMILDLPSYQVIQALHNEILAQSSTTDTNSSTTNIFDNIRQAITDSESDSKSLEQREITTPSSTYDVIPSQVQEVLSDASRLGTSLSWKDRQNVLKYLHDIIASKYVYNINDRILSIMKVLAYEICNYSSNDNLYEAIRALYLLSTAGYAYANKVFEIEVIPHLCDLIRDSPYDERDIANYSMRIIKSLYEVNVFKLANNILKARPKFFIERMNSKWNITINEDTSDDIDYDRKSNNANCMSEVDKWRERERIKRRKVCYSFINSQIHKNKNKAIDARHMKVEDNESQSGPQELGDLEIKEDKKLRGFFDDFRRKFCISLARVKTDEGSERNLISELGLNVLD